MMYRDLGPECQTARYMTQDNGKSDAESCSEAADSVGLERLLANKAG